MPTSEKFTSRQSHSLLSELELDKISVRPDRSPAGYKGLAGFHKYWGKKPTEAWRLLVDALTDKDDIVLDPFLGSGLLAKECVDFERRFIGFDINPISIELTRLYLDLPDCGELSSAIHQIERNIKSTINDMYRVSDGHILTHLLWDGDTIAQVWTKKGVRRIELDISTLDLAQFYDLPRYKSKHTRDIRLFDNSRINSKKTTALEDLFSPRALYGIDLLKEQISNFDGRVKRALLLILSSSVGQMSKMVFAVSGRGKTKGLASDKTEVGSWVIGYWMPEKHFEVNPWNCFENKARKLLKEAAGLPWSRDTDATDDLESVLNGDESACVSLGDSEQLLKKVPSGSVHIVLTDPPHGDRIPYLELSEMWNSVIEQTSNYSDELVISDAKERDKKPDTYHLKLASIFSECHRVLKDGGLLAVMFNSRRSEHWQSVYSMETQFEYIGYYPVEYSARSVVQDTRKGGLKVDYLLLYGKNISPHKKSHIQSTFSTIHGWSTAHPTGAQS